VTGAPVWLLGVAVGAAAGWAAGLAYASRRRHGAGASQETDRPRGYVRAADVAADLPSDAKVDHMARVLANLAAEHVGLPCVVVLRDVDGGPMAIVAVSDGGDPRLIGYTVQPDSPAGRSIVEGTPTVMMADGPSVHVGLGDRRRPLRGGVAVPLQFGSRVDGAVLALGEPADAPSSVVAELEKLARRFAPVVGPAHAVAIAERKANTDDLTGLANRRSLKREMAVGDAGRSALVMIDLDFFKRINDTLGHAAGDQALKHVADLLKTALRAGDVAARVGGEEFAVWLPGADMALGLEVAERLRTLVAEKPFRFGGGEHSITISCGVSASPVPIPSPENLMATADKALYRAKHEGRNRVVATAGKGG
jgi:diguanylate cyclase (GGDEF)-like protein